MSTDAIPTLSFAALLVLSGSAQAGIATCAANSDNRAVAEAYQARWIAALNAEDSERIGSLYAESAVLMPPSDETIVGRQPIATYLHRADVPATRAQYSVDLVSCELRGNALHLAGVWGARTGTSSQVLATGNLLRVLEPGADGNWVSRYEIWN
jgi:ketosteroid isomerase-like protein